MRLLLIHNPKAGYEQVADADRLLAMLRHAGHEVTYQSSEVDDLAGHLQDGWDLIVVAGGDGTVTRVVKLCVDKPTPLAVLPLGTANNLAAAIGHFGPLEDLIKAWDVNSILALDIGVAAGDWGRSRFAESFGVGLLAETIVIADKGNEEKARAKHKTVAERLAAAMKLVRKRLSDLKPVEMTLETSQNVHHGEFLWAEATTVNSVGPRLGVFETHELGDGVLSYAILPVEERETFEQSLVDRIEGRAPRRTGLITGGAAEITITWAKGAAHIDGKLLPEPPATATGPRRAEIAVQPQAVKFVRLRSGR
jgi:diacylglycerol kinase family enzyme